MTVSIRLMTVAGILIFGLNARAQILYETFDGVSGTGSAQVLTGSGFSDVCMYSCINRKTGEIAWRTRGLAKANTIYADGKFIASGSARGPLLIPKRPSFTPAPPGRRASNDPVAHRWLLRLRR